ncbi:hypothetical protein JTE90_003630 [Oedothorax gibbosus]|uniref:Uncharacterized protein n=1 Tax=Oedothorax gibbosus TaxID=931172 RepID=A0AAV6TEB2_9ARAC|nr:hypothetical protein JTE90_003630 [Oedothorax gibbosus]
MKNRPAEVGRLGSPLPLRGGRPGDPPRSLVVAEFERTRWDPKDGELCPDRTRPGENSGGGAVAGSGKTVPKRTSPNANPLVFVSLPTEREKGLIFPPNPDTEMSFGPMR